MKTIPFILVIFKLILAGGSMMAQGPQYITLKGKQFIAQDGTPFFPVVCNYKPYFFRNPATNVDFVTPSHHYGSSGLVECNDQASCITQLKSDFDEIESIGFNTVRIAWGFAGNYCNGNYTSDVDPQISCPEANAIIYYGYEIGGGEIPIAIIKYPFEYSSFNGNDQAYDKIFSYYDAIHQAAVMAGVNIIWLINGNGFESDDANFASAAVDKVIAGHCKLFTKTLAYDLCNEPSPVPNWNTTKEWCCNAVSNMYWSINDPANGDTNHLVTIGAYGLERFFWFDVNVLNVDFFSVHEYIPYLPNSISYTMQDKKNTVLNHFYWLSQVSNKPFIVGETGFRADPATPIEYTDGDVNDQYDFAEETFELCVKCGFSGYSWWSFQDEFDMVNNGAQNREPYGVLYAGLPYLRKPICNYFDYIKTNGIGSISGSCTEPLNYTSNGGTLLIPVNSNTIHGNVTVNGIAQKHSVVLSRNFKHNAKENLELSFNISFTDENGDFIISPIPSDIPNSGGISIPEDPIDDIKITTAGAGRIEKGTVFGFGNIIDYDNYPLASLKFNYNDVFENLNISNNQQLRSWNSISVNNVKIQPLSNVDITARNEVNVSSKFDAIYGSEVHIYTSETFSECSNIPFRIGHNSNSTLIGGTSLNLKLRFIDINFSKRKSNFTLFPNPCLEELYVRSKQKSQYILNASLRDQIGRVIRTYLDLKENTPLDMSGIPSGIYYLEIFNEAETEINYIIHN